MVFNQQDFDIRCEWGENGVNQLLAGSDVMVIVDVLSFSTCVDVATNNGAIIYPYRWQDEYLISYAQERDAVIANRQRDVATGYSLSPSSLLNIPPGTRLVLPSPNGATLSLATQQIPTVAGCLRNASAVAQTIQQLGTCLSIIPAGERWPDKSLRVALEDLIGAGAIIHHLIGTRSPEAQVAELTYLHFQQDLGATLRQCASGKELIERGFASDVELAAGLNQSSGVPIFREGAYVRYGFNG